MVSSVESSNGPTRRFYARRVAGRHRDHRHLDRAVVARGAGRAGGGAADHLRVEFQADRRRAAQLSRRARELSLRGAEPRTEVVSASPSGRPSTRTFSPTWSSRSCTRASRSRWGRGWVDGNCGRGTRINSVPGRASSAATPCPPISARATDAAARPRRPRTPGGDRTGSVVQVNYLGLFSGVNDGTAWAESEAHGVRLQTDRRLRHQPRRQDQRHHRRHEQHPGHGRVPDRHARTTSGAILTRTARAASSFTRRGPPTRPPPTRSWPTRCSAPPP